MKTTNNFKNIVINETPLIDVRAPIEYNKGAFISSINLPLMNDEERHLVGIDYKKSGNASATELGYELVSGTIKETRIQSWVDFIKSNKNTILYCFRGGSRSKISQEWLANVGIDISRIEGGYKAFRRYLIDSLAGDAQKARPVILSGYTGSGKTILLNQVKTAIDLEGIANHRGSAFGNYIDPQPTQINFENNLAYKLIQHSNTGYNHIVLEDESRNVGRCFIPIDLLDYFRSNDYVFLDVPLHGRVDITYDDYVISSQASYKEHFGNEGLEKWYDYINTSMNKAKKRLGSDRYKQVSQSLTFAYKHQLSTGNSELHKDWIELFLRDYYDPMYQYQLTQKQRDFSFSGNSKEVLDYLSTLN